MKTWCMLNVRRRKGRVARNRNQRNSKEHNDSIPCAHEKEIVQLRKWMKLYGFGKCSLVPYIFPETGRGLMASADISSDDLIVAIPRCLLITTETVLASEIGHWIKRWKPLLCPQQILSVYLMWETQKGAASEWHPYIQTLPGSFTTPAYFTDTDLQLLPTAVFQRAVQLNQKLCVFYQQIIDFSDTYWPESVEIFTFEAFRRAWYTVNSRSVYMEIGKSEFVRGVENNLALAPFLDLLNHSTQAQITAGYDRESKTYQIRTLVPYRRYEQVFISYGPADNHKLLLEYGFILPNNPHDVFNFTFDDLEILLRVFDVQFWDKKSEIIRQKHLILNLSCSDEGLSWRLATALQILAMDWQELQQWRGAMHQETVSVKNDRLCQTFARYLVTKAMFEMDNHQVPDNFEDITVNQKMALQLRNIDKEILQKTLDSLVKHVKD
ncbi:hypothetical protein ScPMuIL_013015 [Solemya velum]